MSYYSPTPEENEAYRQLWQVATKGQSSTIGGQDAVKFFLASGLPVTTLKQVWAIASNGQKEMSPREFSTAMRLIALAQKGNGIDPNTLQNTQGIVCGAPSFQGIEIISSPPQPTPSPASSISPPAPGVASPASWAIPPEARAGYEKLWAGLPKNAQGLLEGKDAAAFFANSKQSRETLRTVWQLADVGGDGMMDQTEFLIGMHLTMMAKKGAPLPSVLPPELQRSAGAPFERSASNSSQLSASMMAMMQPSSNSLMGESEKDLNQSSSRLTKQASGRVPEALPPSSGGSSDAGDYESLRQDYGAMNSSLSYATNKLEESRNVVKAQIGRASNELSALRAEKERLMQALTEATNAFQADAEKLKGLDEELAQMREEVNRLRQGVDAKRAAISAQQDMIGSRIDEARALTKQIATVSLGAPGNAAEPQAGQKRRMPPVPPAAAPPAQGSNDIFQNSGFPSGDMSAHQSTGSGGGNFFDSFEDPYAGQGTGGKSNEY